MPEIVFFIKYCSNSYITFIKMVQIETKKLEILTAYRLF